MVCKAAWWNVIFFFLIYHTFVLLLYVIYIPALPYVTKGVYYLMKEWILSRKLQTTYFYNPVELMFMV